MWKKIALFLVAGLSLVAVFYHELIGYGWMQAKGQVSILWNVKPIEQVLQDPTYADSLKERIRLIQEIKQFGYDSLGLNHSDNYTTYYEQHGKPILWNITAAPAYMLQPYEWYFPLLGTFPYKGFFDSTRAAQEIQHLQELGYDTDLGEVAAWSTLGYAKDPILSNMLQRSVGSLANLVLHEITHGTLFVKNDMELNENLATFVGDWGAKKFLASKYGVDSKEYRQYEFGKQYRDVYAQHLLRGAKQLDSLYSTYHEKMSVSLKDSLKRQMIKQIMYSADTLLNNEVGKYRSKDAYDELPNNAFFTGFKTYKAKQSSFKEEFEKQFNSDFARYMAYLKEKYPPENLNIYHFDISIMKPTLKQSIFSTLLVGLTTLLLSFTFVSDYRVIPKKGFSAGEVIEYRVHYGIINAATAKVEVSKNIYTVNKRPCYRVSITGRTIGAFDLVTRVRDTWRSHMDTAAVVPQLFERDIQEGKYRLDEMVLFNHLTNTATVTSKKRNQDAVKFTIPKDAQDLVGSYYYLRTIDFQKTAVGTIIEVPMFFDNEVYRLKVRFAGKETIKTKFGKLETYKLVPFVPANKFFKGEYPMSIWVSNDENRVPLKVEVDLKIGSLGISITDYSGMKKEFKWQ